VTAAFGAASQTVIVLTAAADTIAITLTMALSVATSYRLEQGVRCCNRVDGVLKGLHRQQQAPSEILNPVR